MKKWTFSLDFHLKLNCAFRFSQSIKLVHVQECAYPFACEEQVCLMVWILVYTIYGLDSCTMQITEDLLLQVLTISYDETVA